MPAREGSRVLPQKIGELGKDGAKEATAGGADPGGRDRSRHLQDGTGSVIEGDWWNGDLE